MGKSFIRLSLECVKNWAEWMPFNPITREKSKFKEGFEKLISYGIVFPINDKYFKSNKDINFNSKYLNFIFFYILFFL